MPDRNLQKSSNVNNNNKGVNTNCNYIPETISEVLEKIGFDLELTRKALADRLNESYQTLTKYIKTNEWDEPLQCFPLEKAPLYDKLYFEQFGVAPLLEWHARKEGFIVVPLPEDSTEKECARVIKETAEAISIISVSIADGIITEKEKKLMAKECREAIQALTGYLMHLEQ